MGIGRTRAQTKTILSKGGAGRENQTGHQKTGQGLGNRPLDGEGKKHVGEGKMTQRSGDPKIFPSRWAVDKERLLGIVAWGRNSKDWNSPGPVEGTSLLPGWQGSPGNRRKGGGVIRLRRTSRIGAYQRQRPEGKQTGFPLKSLPRPTSSGRELVQKKTRGTRQKETQAPGRLGKGGPG